MKTKYESVCERVGVFKQSLKTKCEVYMWKVYVKSLCERISCLLQHSLKTTDYKQGLKATDYV